MPEVFKYKNYLFMLSMIWIGAIFTCGSAVLLISVGGVGFVADFFSYLGALILLIASIILPFSWSDVVIDDRGISKRIFGKIWKTYRWEDVSFIRTGFIKSLDPQVKKVQFVVILPKPFKVGDFTPNVFKHVAFNSKFIGFDKLKTIMNTYITQYQITVMFMQGEQKTQQSHI